MSDEWISVKDKMPEKRQKVIVSTNLGDVFDGHFFDGWQFKLRHFGDVTSAVTHWMPLPEPPSNV